MIWFIALWVIEKAHIKEPNSDCFAVWFNIGLFAVEHRTLLRFNDYILGINIFYPKNAFFLITKNDHYGSSSNFVQKYENGDFDPNISVYFLSNVSTWSLKLIKYG